MMAFSMFMVWLQLVLAAVPINAYLAGIPTVPFESSSNASLSLKNITSIIIDSRYVNLTDTAGSTLIPPTLEAFANTFADDLAAYTLHTLPLRIGSSASSSSIFLTIGNSTRFVDAAGRPSNEAYTLDVSKHGIVITGSSPLGVWWGTRSLLQQLVLGDGFIHLGKGTDAAGWGTREFDDLGVMLDAGRHYYPPDFVTDMCSYLSFFKQNTFHLHISDNLYNNVDIYSLERQLDLYAAFRPWSEDPAVAGLNKRRNESYTLDEFDLMQRKCASRGVTIIPEIEAPGHALVITQWKQQLAISSSIDLLNISYPDTIPTMKTIWDTFLPWFHSKVVHIGADEYVDSSLTKDALVDEYTTFVNEMNTYIRSTSNKSMRIWGTFSPSSNATNVATSVSIQHWEFFEANPYLDFIKNGYDVLNSDDAFYIVNKYSASYPQVLNLTRIFHGNPSGGPYAPNIFDTSNATNNPPRNNPSVLGHIAALWNDYGPNATTYNEAYYAWRDGLPALADKQWGGNLTASTYSSIFAPLHAAVPDQNLDRTITSKSSTILSYDFAAAAGNGSVSMIPDLSGNAYNASTDCSLSAFKGLHLTPNCSLSTPLGSKGRNYTLSFSIYPSTTSPGPLFSGSDSVLYAGNGSVTNVMLVAAGNAFALNYSFPVGMWTNAEVIGRGNGTFLKVGNEREMQFLTKVGVNGEAFVWRNIGIEAPVATIGGGGFEGWVGGVKLFDYA